MSGHFGQPWRLINQQPCSIHATPMQEPMLLDSASLVHAASHSSSATLRVEAGQRAWLLCDGPARHATSPCSQQARQPPPPSPALLLLGGKSDGLQTPCS